MRLLRCFSLQWSTAWKRMLKNLRWSSGRFTAFCLAWLIRPRIRISNGHQYRHKLASTVFLMGNIHVQKKWSAGRRASLWWSMILISSRKNSAGKLSGKVYFLSEARPNMSEISGNYMIFSAWKRTIRCVFFNLIGAYLFDYQLKNKIRA